MKNFFIFLLLVFCFLFPPIVSAQTNIGFENGSTSGWTITGLGAAVVSSGGNDPLISTIPCVYSGGGKYSVRIGDNKNQKNIFDETIKGDGASLMQTFTVSTSNACFIYHYAVVLQDGGHDTSDQPFFEVKMYDKNNNEINCATYEVNANTADAIGGFYNYIDCSYKKWTSILVPLDNYIGQSVTVEFKVDWCKWEVHCGYATQQNPSHSYSSAGDFTVTLII
jgi:hypothetical protein